MSRVDLSCIASLNERVSIVFLSLGVSDRAYSKEKYVRRLPNTTERIKLILYLYPVSKKGSQTTIHAKASVLRRLLLRSVHDVLV